MNSTQELVIVNLAVKTKLLLDSVDTWLLQQPTLVNARKRKIHPAVLEDSNSPTHWLDTCSSWD